MKRSLLLIALLALFSLLVLGSRLGAAAGPLTTPGAVPYPPNPTATPPPAGSAFTYQGQLQFNNAPATGSYDFQFTLYDSASGGNAVAGPVVVLSQTVSNGLFTVQ